MGLTCVKIIHAPGQRAICLPARHVRVHCALLQRQGEQDDHFSVGCPFQKFSDRLRPLRFMNWNYPAFLYGGDKVTYAVELVLQEAQLAVFEPGTQ